MTNTGFRTMNKLNKAIATINKLKTTNSVKDKEDILKEELDNHPLQVLLEANLNPYKLFYIRKVPKYYYKPEQELSQIQAWKKFLELLDLLNTRAITGNKAIEATIELLSRVEPELATIFEVVLFKLAIGVGASTVNKVWPNLIPTFDVMLAPSELANVVNIKYPVYGQPKKDGIRSVYIPLNGEITLWTRSGKILGNKSIISYFKALGNVTDTVLDGELYSHSISFEQLLSVLTTEDAVLPKDLKFTVFDAVPLKDWQNKRCKLRYEQRLQLIRETLNDKVADYKKVVDIETKLIYNSKELVDLYKKHLKDGYEGSMCKNIDGLYQWKRVTTRSGEMLKLKPMETVDVKVDSIFEGQGQFSDIAGGISFLFNNNVVSCGSGFSIEQRKQMSESPNKFIGKTAEIKYTELTEAGSLRHPVFIRWRTDKD